MCDRTVLFRTLAAVEGMEAQPQTILLILCKYRIGDHLILSGGEAMTVWDLVVCKQGKEQNSRVII